MFTNLAVETSGARDLCVNNYIWFTYIATSSIRLQRRRPTPEGCMKYHIYFR